MKIEEIRSNILKLGMLDLRSYEKYRIFSKVLSLEQDFSGLSGGGGW